MIRGVILALILAAPALADGPEAIEVRYRCDGDLDLPVVFLNGVSPDPLAVTSIEGRLVAMRQVVSGSGFRYLALDADRPYVLRGKGDSATLYLGEDEAPAILTGCKAME